MNVGRYLRGEDRHVGTARTTQFQQPQRKPLTDEEIDALLMPFPKYASEWDDKDFYQFARAIEAKLKEKNT